jgi:hypothetical protein
MYLFSTAKSAKALTLAFVFACFSISFISAQATFRISKPIVGTNKVCSIPSSGYANYLSFAFSSNVVNSTGSVASHVVELSNENGLITPRQVYYVSPNLNTISTGAFDISGQSLPIGSGYRIRILTNTPSFFSDYSETFDFVASPDRPVLDYSGSVDLCIGATQTLTVTNPNITNTYQWINNYSFYTDPNIANATSSSYSVTTSGYYSVKTTNQNGCTVSSSPVSVNRVSTFSGSMYATANYTTDNPLFVKSNQAFNLTVYANAGKSPYSFILNDGANNTTETNINYSKSYSLVAPTSGSNTYRLSSLTDACGTQLINSTSLRVRINDSKYCSVNGGNTTIGIKNFAIQGTTINNLNSGRALDGWGEYLSSANINANVNYNFSITPLTQGQQVFSIWADLNQNGTFDSGERIFPTGNNSSSQTISGTFSGIIKLPSITYNGQTRIRVIISQYDSYYSPTCGTLSSSGEAEDYVLSVFNGALPVTITTDSVPKLGVCHSDKVAIRYTISGGILPANTAFRVEASERSDFSYPTIIGTGTSSPIMSNTNSFINNSSLYVRVVPVNNGINRVIQKAPNLLLIKPKPDVNLYAGIYYTNLNYGYFATVGKYLSIDSSTPISIFANASTQNYPLTIEMSDGRTFTAYSSYNYSIMVENNILVTGDMKYKLKRSFDNVCANITPDSVTVSAGSPSLKIMKVQKSYYDTTSTNKLCGQFIVRFAGEHLDSLYYKFYHVQISDNTGSFNNPKDIGHVCITQVLNESKGGQIITCEIPPSLNLPTGNGYRLRVIKKTANVISPVYGDTFELINSAITLTPTLTKDAINEGEATNLNVAFSGGIPPYRLNLFSSSGSYQSITSSANNTYIDVNLASTFSLKYSLSYYGACATNYSSSNQSLYLNVKTLDKNNAQWYVKPYQNNSYYELLKNTYILGGTDTLFKRPFNHYSPNVINQYYDYNSTSLLKPVTVLKSGENYSMGQVSNNNANSSSQNLLTGIWVDLNQDGDFDDAGEELNKNPFAQHWTGSQIQNITIPNNANLGFTRLRMRVMSKGYNAEPFDLLASNPIEREGNTYDIPIVILSNTITGIISTPKISGNTLCNGNSFNVEFSPYGIPAGTSASVELSDVSGNFPATPAVIGQGSTSSINVTLPLTIPSGNYNIRVVSNGVISPLSTSFNVTTNQLTSMVDGDWHAGSTWSCGRVPTYVDATTVAGGTTVTVFSGDARVGSILTNGILSFLNGTTLRFRQP